MALVIVVQPQYSKRPDPGQNDAKDCKNFVVAQFVTDETYSHEHKKKKIYHSGGGCVCVSFFPPPFLFL